MSLQLVKIESGLCGGEVLHHAFGKVWVHLVRCGVCVHCGHVIDVPVSS